MPVQPSISPDQIVTIVAFLLLLFTLMWLIKRNRGGIASRLRPARRMTHIEDLALAPHQRLHLIEVDGRTFMVHAGKGHAASFIAVDGEPPAEMAAAPANTVAASKVKSKKQGGGQRQRWQCWKCCGEDGTSGESLCFSDRRGTA